jgi:hypothetical protein
MVRWGGGRDFAHLHHHRDVRPSRTEDYYQNGYENHPTTSTRVESETPTSRKRLEVSGIMAYFVERTPLVRVQIFHAELTHIGQRSRGITRQPARHLLRGSTRHLLRDGLRHLLRES